MHCIGTNKAASNIALTYYCTGHPKPNWLLFMLFALEAEIDHLNCLFFLLLLSQEIKMSGLEFEGKVAIITGAASGIGAAAAAEFVRRGAKVGLDHSIMISISRIM